MIGFYEDCGGILAALIIIDGYKDKIKKKINKRGITKPINECELYAGGVAGDAFKLCFHDAGNFMPGC